MEPALLSATAAVMGSLVGGIATMATAWITQAHMRRRELAGTEIRKREQLYADFIAECTRLAIDAYAHSFERLDMVMPAYALLNRIRLTSSEAVVAAAEATVRRISDQYFAPNLSIEELRALARSASADPFQAFSEACRQEIAALQKEA
jgi:hypothetical protein